MTALLVFILIPPLIPAFVLGEVQFLLALCIEDRVVRTLLLLPLPGLALMTGGAFFFRLLHLPPSFFGPLFSDKFFFLLWTAVIFAGILVGGGLGRRARRRR